jgi:acetylornithine deacetylase/succinyl-diaminopimelate desuccinylase-like protein
MKDDGGRVTIDGFYDDVTPLTQEERQAIDQIPDVATTLMQTFGFSQPETKQERLEQRHNLPTLNINAMDAGGGVAGQGRTVIPASASARLDLRLVKAIDPTKQFERLVAHVRKQGFFIVDLEPDAPTRAAHPWIARVTRSGGYPAGRTAMNVPIAATISKALADAAGGPIVRLPTIGGSAVLSSSTCQSADLRAVDRQFRTTTNGPFREPAVQNL